MRSVTVFYLLLWKQLLKSSFSAKKKTWRKTVYVNGIRFKTNNNNNHHNMHELINGHSAHPIYLSHHHVGTQPPRRQCLCTMVNTQGHRLNAVTGQTYVTHTLAMKCVTKKGRKKGEHNENNLVSYFLFLQLLLSLALWSLHTWICLGCVCRCVDLLVELSPWQLTLHNFLRL